MQEIKKLFFTYRNGAVADTLRRYGIPHKVIFGLQIPQLAAIARELQFGTPADREAAADKLWADREVRESRLLACYLFDPQTITLDKALELACDTRTQEESDMLAFLLLKHLPDAAAIAGKLEMFFSEDNTATGAKRTAASLRNHLR